MRPKHLVAKISTTLVALALLSGPGLCSPTVQALYLPPGSTITPEGERVLMASQTGVIAATIQLGSTSSSNSAQRVVVWRNGEERPLDLVSQYETGVGPNFQTLGAVAADGHVYVNAGYPFSGAYSGIKYHTFIYENATYREFPYPSCDLKGQPGDPIIEGADADQFAVTFISPELIDFDNVDSGVYAPNATIISPAGCDVIGRANILAISGKYAAGFRGYLGTVLAPTNLNLQQQTYRAVRWAGGQLKEIGEGVAFDVSSSGACVGATAPTGDESFFMVSGHSESSSWSNTYRYGIPHAVLWRYDGTELNLDATFRSVAYAIDDNDRVVGMERDSNGRHFAFLWQDGTLKRLDDLVQATRWRFESAYGFTSDGGIFGIGTHDGVATAFIVHL